jgi:cytochrome c peroxidase
MDGRPRNFPRSIAWLLAFAAGSAVAANPATLLDGYVAEARRADAEFAPQASRGEAFFRQQRATANGPMACANCHTDDPRKEGRTRAHKTIAPLAPAANAARFADAAKVEKWFGRNCGDFVGRACTPAEKADFIAWLISVR